MRLTNVRGYVYCTCRSVPCWGAATLLTTPTPTARVWVRIAADSASRGKVLVAAVRRRKRPQCGGMNASCSTWSQMRRRGHSLVLGRRWRERREGGGGRGGQTERPTPYHATSCHAMSCHGMPYHATPCHAMSCHAISCHALPGGSGWDGASSAYRMLLGAGRTIRALELLVATMRRGEMCTVRYDPCTRRHRKENQRNHGTNT